MLRQRRCLSTVGEFSFEAGHGDWRITAMHSGFRSLISPPSLGFTNLSTAQPQGSLQHRQTKADQDRGTLMASHYSSYIIGSLVLALLVLTFPTLSRRSTFVSVLVHPHCPDTRSACPADRSTFDAGYRPYDSDYNDYYWVPGTWVMAPQPGLFWTPGYWAWNGNGFLFNEGYRAPQVGFYGGINYGYGYFGQGYQGSDGATTALLQPPANNVNVTTFATSTTPPSSITTRQSIA